MEQPLETPVDDFFRRAAESSGGELSLRTWLGLAEAWRIRLALRQSRGNRSAAARSLGIGRRTLYTKLKKLGPAARPPATPPIRTTELGSVGAIDPWMRGREIGSRS